MYLFHLSGSRSLYCITFKFTFIFSSGLSLVKRGRLCVHVCVCVGVQGACVCYKKIRF